VVIKAVLISALLLVLTATATADSLGMMCSDSASTAYGVTSGTRGIYFYSEAPITITGVDLRYNYIGFSTATLQLTYSRSPDPPFTGGFLPFASTPTWTWNTMGNTASMDLVDSELYHVSKTATSSGAYHYLIEIVTGSQANDPNVRRLWTGPAGACGSEAFYSGIGGNSLDPSKVLAMDVYGDFGVALEPTPTPHYNAPELIGGLIGDGAEDDAGVGLVGGGIGVVVVGLIGALVGTGAVLLAIGGLLAIVLLVVLGVIPNWTLVVLLPVLLVAAYIRYALGGKS
jgi:hypothetical protein